MPVIIPVEPSIAFQEMDLSLDGYAFKLKAHWNSRSHTHPQTGEWVGAWFLSFYEENGTPINVGCKAVAGTFIGRVSNHRLFRRGVFVMEDTTGGRQDATYDNFGTSVQLRYYTEADIAANIIARYNARSA